MIIVWFWNLVVQKISDTCMFFNLAKAIRIAIEQTYFKEKYVAKIYNAKEQQPWLQIKGKGVSTKMEMKNEGVRAISYIIHTEPIALK